MNTYSCLVKIKNIIMIMKQSKNPQKIGEQETEQKESIITKEQDSNRIAVLQKVYPTKNKRSVWSVTNKPYKDAHFAVYPPDLIEPCIKAGSEVGDIVLDPFMGSGTTAMVAKALGRDYIGCELHEDYGNLIKKRVQDYVPVKEATQESCINILDII